MHSSNNDDSQLDFSVISKKQNHRNQLNFSVQSLLEEEKSLSTPSSKRESVKNQPQQQAQPNNSMNQSDGSFMKDLQKLQKSLSFESQEYDIFEGTCEGNPFSKSKTLSHLKVTKENTKQETNYDFSWNDYGYLIVDFEKGANQIKKKKLKLESNHPLTHDIYRLTSKSNSSLLKNSHSIAKEDTCRKSLTKFLSPLIKTINKDISSFHLDHPQITKVKSKSKIHRSKSKSFLKINKTENPGKADKIYTEYYGETQIKPSQTFYQQPSKHGSKQKKMKGLKSKDLKSNKCKGTTSISHNKNLKEAALSPRNKIKIK